MDMGRVYGTIPIVFEPPFFRGIESDVLRGIGLMVIYLAVDSRSEGCVVRAVEFQTSAFQNLVSWVGLIPLQPPGHGREFRRCREIYLLFHRRTFNFQVQEE